LVTVIGVWEDGWMETRTERRLWSQTLHAYEVDRWIMVPARENTKFPEQVPTLQEALDSIDENTQRVFLIPEFVGDFNDLNKYSHCRDAAYIFGNAKESLRKYVRRQDDVVSILTPSGTDMFAAVAVGQVLHARTRVL